MNDFRIGFGYDSHRFSDDLSVDKPFILGGITIPYTKHCVAHSDGDVLFHALADALLGALALPDIGQNFPDNDPANKNLDSAKIIEFVVSQVEEKGFRINNIDLTVILEQPKLSPFKEAIRENVARLCHLSLDRVSVKAKTNEKMDAIGAGQGVAVHAAVSVIQ